MKKFLCDKMCSNLGRWLRAAGYDTFIVDTPLQDQQIFKMAVEERRQILTRDKYFKELDPEEKIVIYLKGETLNGWALLLTEKGIDWLYHPFSRCLQCNSILEKADAPIGKREDIPDDVKEFWSCPHCHQLFWMGSHTESMKHRLRMWSISAP